MQLHAVTAFHLEGGVIGGGGGVVHIGIVVVMNPHIRAPGNHSDRHRQPGRAVVLALLADDAGEYNKKCGKYQNK